MTPDSAQTFGVALVAMWGAAGGVALGRSVAKSPAVREIANAVRRMNLAAKGALVAGLVGAVAVGGTKPEGRGAPTARPLGGRFGESSLPAPPFALVEVCTNGVALVPASTNAVISESIRRRGTSEGGEWIETDASFFLWGTNPVSRVFASPAVLSFGSMQHPPLGAALPDGSPAESLVALRMPLGLAPEANWSQLAEPSRFWHEATSFGRVFTWENALLDRLADRPATIQIETRADGDFFYRYDFSAAAPTNGFFAGAQLGPAAVEALGVRGGVTNAATVYRVNGAPAPAGVSVADLFTAPRLELRWKTIAGLGDLSGDTDGDGLADWDETFRYDTDPRLADTDGDGLSDAAEILLGSNPLDADENGDGVPDGTDPATWAANPLWATNAVDGANVAIRLDADVSGGGSAVLILGSLAIPLRHAGAWELHIPAGPTTPFELRTTDGAEVLLSVSEPTGGATDPIHLHDPDGVFRVSSPLRLRSAPARRPSNGGAGHLCVFDVRFANLDTGEQAPADECIHDETGVRRLTLQFSDSVHEGLEPTWSAPTMSDVPGWIELHVSSEPGDSDSATVTYESPQLVCGSKTVAASIHRCSGGILAWCHACGMYHDPDDPHACPHEAACPATTDPAAECTCPVPVIRVSGTGTALSEFAGLDFPDEAFCCCSRPSLFTYARLTHIDANLSIWDGVAPSNWVDAAQCPVSVTVYATAESGNAPSEIGYQLVRRRYDESGGVATNEVFGTRTLRIWATTTLLEPITTARVGDRIVNPCGIVLGEPATFRMEMSPAAFPDSLIEWTATPEGRVRFDGGIRTGRQVTVTGVTEGDVTLTAHITGYAGPPPLVRARVMPRTTVPVYAWIVCGASGVPAVEESVLRGKFPEINRIWDQAGITWQLAEVNFVTNQAWMSIEDDEAQAAIHASICSYGNASDGVELYCIGTMEHAGGLTSPRGSVVVGSAAPSVYAHEFGHLCKLKDVYPRRPRKTELVVTGGVSRSRSELDWPSAADEGYYPNALQQTELIGRLLMCGIATETGIHTDISAGDVYGLWRHWRKAEDSDQWDWFHDLGTVPVGFHLHGDKQPIVDP